MYTRSVSSSREPSSAMRWRISSGSRTALSSVVISRSARSIWAWRASSVRDRSSCSMSRALVMASDAWWARMTSSSASSGPYASSVSV